MAIGESEIPQQSYYYYDYNKKNLYNWNASLQLLGKALIHLFSSLSDV